MEKKAGGARRAREQQRARRVLVEPVDELGPRRASSARPSSSPSRCCGGLGPALGGEARRLVDDDRRRILWITISRTKAISSSLSCSRSRALGAAARRPARPGARGSPGPASIRSPGAARLPSSAELAGARPARDEVEAGIGQVALEPAIEADAVVVGRDGELADLSPLMPPPVAQPRPANSSRTEPITEATT